MSIRVCAMVWACRLESTERFVLLKMADCAHDDGSHVYPSVATIAADTGVSERHIQRIISGWTRTGLLHIVSPGGGRRPRVYRIDLAALAALRRADAPPRGDAMSPLASGDSQVVDPKRVDEADPARGDTMSPLGPEPPVEVTPCHPSGDKLSHPSGDKLSHPNPQGTVTEPSTPPAPPTGGEGEGLAKDGLVAVAIGLGKSRVRATVLVEAALTAGVMPDRLRAVMLDAAAGGPAGVDRAVLAEAERVRAQREAELQARVRPVAARVGRMLPRERDALCARLDAALRAAGRDPLTRFARSQARLVARAVVEMGLAEEVA